MRYSVLPVERDGGKSSTNACRKTNLQQRDFSIFPRTRPPQQEGVDGWQPRTLSGGGGEALSCAAGRIVATGLEAGCAFRCGGAQRQELFPHQPRHPLREGQNTLSPAHVCEVFRASARRNEERATLHGNFRRFGDGGFPCLCRAKKKIVFNRAHRRTAHRGKS